MEVPMKFTNSILLASAATLFSFPVMANTVTTKVEDLSSSSEVSANPSADAKVVTIKALPDSGLVKVNGTIDNVSSARKFTLKDQTGHVDVAMEEEASTSLKKGLEVSVVGN